jgi:uracil-DNA glycosylase family 4
VARLPKPEQCRGCPGDSWQHVIPGTKLLTPPRTGFSQSEGHGTNGVLVVGEALGANEDADGLPFRPQAPAGSLLERAFKRCGYDRSNFRITNIVRCRPPNDYLVDAPYEFDVIQHCRPYLFTELTAMKPRCILALGGTAARELTGLSGKAAGVSYTRGYVLPCIVPPAYDVPVVASFHPSFLRQGNPHLFGVLCADLRQAVEVARTGGKWATTDREVHEHVYEGSDDIPF